MGVCPSYKAYFSLFGIRTLIKVETLRGGKISVLSGSGGNLVVFDSLEGKLGRSSCKAMFTPRKKSVFFALAHTLLCPHHSPCPFGRKSGCIA